MRKFVTIRKVGDIKPIAGADRVELAFIDGWRCVVLKGQYSIGEEIVFIEADAALKNIDDTRFEFLKKSSYKCWKKDDVVIDECLRIKTVRLAGQFSQGLVLKKSLFEAEIAESLEDSKTLDEALNVVHYDELNAFNQTIVNPENVMHQRGSFPSFVPKTDEERLQNLPEYFEEYKEELFEVTFKYDGSSMSVGYSPSKMESNPFFVCSRNFSLDIEADNNFCRTAKRYKFNDILIDYHNETGLEICLQGELIGPGINGNRGGYTGVDFFVFRIFNITHQCWFTPEQRLSFCDKYKIPHVCVFRNDYKAFTEHTSVESMIELTYQKNDNGRQIEGLVFKSQDGSVSFKVINPNYLLKNQDK